jgi:hypothetical protein
VCTVQIVDTYPLDWEVLWFVRRLRTRYVLNLRLSICFHSRGASFAMSAVGKTSLLGKSEEWRRNDRSAEVSPTSLTDSADFARDA